MAEYYEQTLKLLKEKKEKLTEIYLNDHNNNNSMLSEIEQLDIKIIEYNNKLKEEKEKGK